MADINYTASTPKKSYTRRIGDHGFLGADFSTAPIFASDRRFRDLKNVWKDYKSGSGVAIETVPGYRSISYNGVTVGQINGIHTFYVSEDYWEGSESYLKFEDVNPRGLWYFVHYGKRIACFREIDDGAEERYVVCYRDGMLHDTECLPNEKSFSVQYGDKLLLVCGGSVYEIRLSKLEDWFGDDMEQSNSLRELFVIEQAADRRSFYTPITYIDGDPYEQKNMLSRDSKEIYHKTISELSASVYGVEILFHEKVEAYEAPATKYYISSVKVDGVDVSSSSDAIINGSYISGLSIGGFLVSDVGKDVVVEVVYTSAATGFTSYRSYEDYKDRTTFNEGNPGYSGTAFDAIAGCTICATFDERIFLAGNPKLPNTVFYSQRDLTGYNNPTYFGVLNYNNLGTSNAPITAMIPSANALYVLKDDSATDPTMYVLSGFSTEKDLIPRVYTVESGLPGIGCKGAACNFLDDIVFMSRNGVIGIDKQAVNLERTLGDRSVLINGKLLLEDVTQAVFAEAEGYLWVLFKNNGHVYLADSRAYTQGAGYEWYYIDSVGSWENDADKWEFVNEYLQIHGDTVYDFHGAGGYQYATRALFELKAPSLDGYEVRYQPDGSVWLMAKSGTTSYKIVPYPTEHEAYTGNGQITVYLDYTGIEGEYDDRRDRTDMTYSKDTSGAFVCLVETSAGSGEYYQVKPTGEKISVEGTTVFHPATCMVASNDRIFFGTDNGDLLTFNNDKRGVQAESEIVSGTTYGENRYPFLLRPEWYSFCGHRIESFVETSDDDGGIGNVTKDTVRRSAVVDMKAMLGSKYKITTYTDRDGWKNDNAATGSMNDASQTMLDAVNFSGDEHINVQIRERARKWVHKRYRIESNGFRSPFGLYRITYNFEINGRIK